MEKRKKEESGKLKKRQLPTSVNTNSQVKPDIEKHIPTNMECFQPIFKAQLVIWRSKDAVKLTSPPTGRPSTVFIIPFGL